VREEVDDDEVFGGDSSAVAVEKRVVVVVVVDCILLLEIMGERTTAELKPLVDEIEDRRRVTAVTMAAVVGVGFMVEDAAGLYFSGFIGMVPGAMFCEGEEDE
jgi:hypothetical protein